MTTYAKFIQRNAGVTMELRDIYICEDNAEGKEILDGIGYGKVTIPHYDNFGRAVELRVQPGDICMSWTDAPDGNSHAIATFIVKTRTYKNSKYEISGPDLIAELAEYVAIAPVGAVQEVVTAAASMGTYLIQQPGDDPVITMAAAYPPRFAITTVDKVANGTRANLEFVDETPMQVSDVITINYADGTVFQSVVTSLDDWHHNPYFEDPLPQTVPAGSKIIIHSTRLRVDDASALLEGHRVQYTPAPYSGKWPSTYGNIMVDRIELGSGENDPDYIYSADPITDYILVDTVLTQFQYTAPSANDVGKLLLVSTFGEWTVDRGDNTTTGTAYAPNAETVWDVLLAIRDISGYHFRRAFPALPIGETLSVPTRRLEYFVHDHPVTVPDVDELGMAHRLDSNYGTLLSLEYEDNRDVITHLIPFGGGGGSGRLDFSRAPKETVLEDYPDLDWGVVNRHHYIYNAELSDGRQSWAVETFSHISPADDTDPARVEAATMLLRAACDWLMERSAPDITYNAEIFTTGEPRPGDVVSIDWRGVDPTATTDSNLIITEVEHRMEGGLRRTRLVMNKAGRRRYSGADSIAKTILNMGRALRGGNFSGGGGAGIGSGGIDFGDGDSRIVTDTGDLDLESRDSDINIDAPAGVINLSAPQVNINGPLYVTGSLKTEGGVILIDEANGDEWSLSMITVRGVPRIKFTRLVQEGA